MLFLAHNPIISKSFTHPCSVCTSTPYGVALQLISSCINRQQIGTDQQETCSEKLSSSPEDCIGEATAPIHKGILFGVVLLEATLSLILLVICPIMARCYIERKDIKSLSFPQD